MAGLLLIIIIVLVISGAARLPEIGRGFGDAVRNFKKNLAEPDEIDVSPGKNKKSPGELKKDETRKEDKPG